MLASAALIANQFKMDPRVVVAAGASDRVILAAAYNVAHKHEMELLQAQVKARAF